MEATKQANIINSHPIKEGLVAFRHQFESSQARLGFGGHPFRRICLRLPSLRAQQLIILLTYIKDLVLDLIGALQTLPAARVLRSQIDRKTRLRAGSVQPWI
jgi:hypothetical protein